MPLNKLAPELLRMILMHCIDEDKDDTLEAVLELRLVNKVIGAEIIQAIYTSRILDDTKYRWSKSSSICTGYILHRALADANQFSRKFSLKNPWVSSFSVIYCVAEIICRWNKTPAYTALISCILRLAPFVVAARHVHKYPGIITKNSDQFEIELFGAVACLNCHGLTRKMLSKGRKPWIERTIFGWPIQAAAGTGDLDTVKLFFASGICKPTADNVESMIHFGIMSAIESDQVSVLDHLISINRDLSQPSNERKLDLIEFQLPKCKTIAMFEHVRTLLTSVSGESKRHFYDRMLIDAAGWGSPETVQHCINNGACINDTMISPWVDMKGIVTPLTRACHHSLQMVTLILDLGADPNLRGISEANYSGNLLSPLEHATTEGDLRVVKLLLAKHADPGSNGIPGIISMAAELEKMDIVELLQNHYASE